MEENRVNGIEETNHDEIQQNVNAEGSQEEKEESSEAVLEAEENVKNEKRKLSKRTKIILSAAGVLVLAAIAIVVALVVKANNEAAHAEKVQKYLEDMRKCSATMILAAAEAEDICNLTNRVWHNTIFKESDKETNKYTINPDAYSEDIENYSNSQFVDDFNVSLVKLYKSDYMKGKLEALDLWNEAINENQKKLSNVPEECEEEYKTFSDLADAYFNLANFAKEPSGSLQTYSTKLEEYDSEFISLYNKLDRQLPKT